MLVRRRIAGTLVLLLALASCAKSSTPGAGAPSLSIGSVPKSVGGNVVTLPVTVRNIQIVKADGDASGKTGHFHVFIDSDPPAVGQTIPKQRGIVHSADDPIKIFGLKPGTHTFTVVLGNGLHQRIAETAQDEVTVKVKGPSVWGSAPPTIASGADYTIELKSAGLDIKPVGGSMSSDGESGAMSSGIAAHYHVLVDPAAPPQAGDALPAPKEGKVYHTGESSLTIKGLADGEHIVWIVGGDLTHKAFDPPVMDKLTVTVG